MQFKFFDKHFIVQNNLRVKIPNGKVDFICFAVFFVRLAAHVSNGCKSRIRPTVGRI